MYKTAVALAASGRLSTKNAWALDLIDHAVEASTAAPTAGRLTNFAVASATLDASVKIYGYRVDAVHTEAYAVLGGLTRSSAQELIDGDDDVAPASGADENDHEAAAKAKAAARKRRAAAARRARTLEADPAALNAPYELDFDVDPLFKKTSATFDEGGARGLLLTQLPLGRGCVVQFDNKGGDAGAGEAAAMAPLPAALLPTGLATLDVCPQFRQFCNELYGTSFALGAPGAASFAMHDDDVAFDNSVDFGDAGAGDADADDAFDAAEADVFFGDADEGTPAPQALESHMQFDLESAVAAGSEEDFAFFDPAMLRNWAGPAHWKFGSAARDTARGPQAQSADAEDEESAPESAAARRAPRSAPVVIDFCGAPVDRRAAFKKAARPSAIRSAKTAAPEEVTLPVDLHFDPKRMARLFLLPGWGFSAARGPVAGVAGGWQASVLGGGGDDEPFVPDFGGDLDAGDYDVGDAAFDEEAADGGAPAGDRPEWLLNAADRAGISYAKRAKQVDVKALKRNIWSQYEGGQRTFTGFVDALPASLPADQAEDVSPQYAFICLLHLANEHDLLIEDAPGLDQLTVSAYNKDADPEVVALRDAARPSRS